MAERSSDKYNGVIKILIGREEWPLFKEFIKLKINFFKDINSSVIISTEEEKAKHNARIGFIKGLELILTVEEDIENTEKWEKTMQERLLKAEKYNQERGI